MDLFWLDAQTAAYRRRGMTLHPAALPVPHPAPCWRTAPRSLAAAAWTCQACQATTHDTRHSRRQRLTGR